MRRKDEEDHTVHGIIARIVAGVIIFAVLAFVLKLGVESILSVKIPLIIIAVICAVIVGGIQAYRYWRNHNDY